MTTRIIGSGIWELSRTSSLSVGSRVNVISDNEVVLNYVASYLTTISRNTPTSLLEEHYIVLEGDERNLHLAAFASVPILERNARYPDLCRTLEAK